MISLVCNGEEMRLFGIQNIESIITGRYGQDTERLIVKVNGKEITQERFKSIYTRYGDRIEIAYK